MEDNVTNPEEDSLDLLDPSQYLIAYKIVLSIAFLICYIYVEKLKNFHRFNINKEERNSLLVQCCLLQAGCLSYILTVY